MKKKAAWALCLLWMGLIFLMSAMPGDLSGAQSSTVTRVILHMVERLAGPEAAAGIDVPLLDFLVRKAAHMGEYAVLCMLFANAMTLSLFRRPRLWALLASTLYAASDEIHQAFSPGRGPSARDVLIDASGAAIGLLVFTLVKYFVKFMRNRRKMRTKQA